MKPPTILAAVVALIAGSQAGAAERTTTWLTPLGGVVGSYSRTVKPREFFYSQPLAYKGAARLAQTYVEGSGPNALTVPSGEPLFQVSASSGDFWCTARSFRNLDAGSAVGLGLRYSILGQLAGKSSTPRQLSWQCFRDKDGDMAFDEVGGGGPQSGFATMLVGAVNDVVPLPTPVRYEKVDPSTAFAPITLGISVSQTADRKAHQSYLVGLCDADLRPPAKGDCFEQQQYKIGPDGGLPAVIEVLGGRIVITALTTADDGSISATYSVDRPFSAPLSASILLKSQGAYSIRKYVILVPGG